jgi:ankyrin repeat protein
MNTHALVVRQQPVIEELSSEFKHAGTVVGDGVNQAKIAVEIQKACKSNNETKALSLLARNDIIDLDVLDDQKSNALHYACLYNMSQTINELVQRNIPLNQANNEGKTPLHYLCQHEAPALLKLMIKNGAKKSVQDNEGNTPLHIACTHCKLGMIEVLAESKQALNRYNDAENTPLFISIKHSHVEGIRMLLAHGADTNLEDKLGNKPHNCAKFYPRIPDQLIAKMKEKATPLTEKIKSKAKALISKGEEA